MRQQRNELLRWSRSRILRRYLEARLILILRCKVTVWLTAAFHMHLDEHDGTGRIAVRAERTDGAEVQVA